VAGQDGLSARTTHHALQAGRQLGDSDSIALGGYKSFSFTITAPSAPGFYAYHWRMMQVGVGFFGELSDLVVIHVT
jgi:hypothetical protein